MERKIVLPLEKVKTMRIEIEKQIDAETKEVWSFNMFGFTAVFVGWVKFTKPKGKRKWTSVADWDKYKRTRYLTAEEPELPELIKSDVITEIIKLLTVKTWAEWKETN